MSRLTKADIIEANTRLLAAKDSLERIKIKFIGGFNYDIEDIIKVILEKFGYRWYLSYGEDGNRIIGFTKK